MNDHAWARLKENHERNQNENQFPIQSFRAGY